MLLVIVKSFPERTQFRMEMLNVVIVLRMKIFEMAKLMAQHVGYLPTAEQAHVRDVIASRLRLPNVATKRLAVSASA